MTRCASPTPDGLVFHVVNLTGQTTLSMCSREASNAARSGANSPGQPMKTFRGLDALFAMPGGGRLQQSAADAQPIPGGTVRSSPADGETLGWPRAFRSLASCCGARCSGRCFRSCCAGAGSILPILPHRSWRHWWTSPASSSTSTSRSSCAGGCCSLHFSHSSGKWPKCVGPNIVKFSVLSAQRRPTVN